MSDIMHIIEDMFRAMVQMTNASFAFIANGGILSLLPFILIGILVGRTFLLIVRMIFELTSSFLGGGRALAWHEDRELDQVEARKMRKQLEAFRVESDDMPDYPQTKVDPAILAAQTIIAIVDGTVSEEASRATALRWADQCGMSPEALRELEATDPWRPVV